MATKKHKCIATPSQDEWNENDPLLHYFLICEDRVEGKIKLSGCNISGKFETEALARPVLEWKKKDHPNAYLMEVRILKPESGDCSWWRIYDDGAEKANEVSHG